MPAKHRGTRQALAAKLRLMLDHPWVRSPYFWAIVVRLLMALVPRQLQGDAADYHLIASNLAAGHGFSRCYEPPYAPTAQRPPLYSLILALVYLIAGSGDHSPILLNLACDLLSMRLARVWAKDLRFSTERFAPWVIALCPLLITYSPYPTTENMSVMLFLAATVLTFRAIPVASGFAWGLLSLCRSYYLLFPFALLIPKPPKGWDRKGLAVLAAMSLAAPTVWVARNYQAFHRLAFSQSGMVGWQMYQGLCLPAFDWWRVDHIENIFSQPALVKMLSNHCTREDEIFEQDEAAKELVRECVTRAPAEAARNFVIKEINLFTNWGILFPYNRTPFVIGSLINAALFYFWWCVAQAVRRNRKRIAGPLREAFRFAFLNVAYVVAVTLPFALDARYLLAPVIAVALVAIELARGPWKLFRSGIPGGAKA